MSQPAFSVTRDELRRELGADLGRGGYVLRDKRDEGEGAELYFDKHLVLSRPGLLTRAAELLADLVPQEAERLAVVGAAAVTIATALSQRTGIPLLIGRELEEGKVRFEGEHYSSARCVLVEDVVHTGRRAALGARSLAALDASVLSVICLLDRENGAAKRLADAGFALRPLFLEGALLGLARSTP